MSQNDHVYAIILAGGEGVRFAPYSTPEKPKQFLHITNSKRTMIQQTYDRISGFISPEHLFVSTNDKYETLIKEQLPEIPSENIIGEPKKKNTAPAIALICHLIMKRDPDAVTLFLPADHYIADPKGAVELFKKAAEVASEGNSLVTFGIPPTFPSSDYGYIKRGNLISSDRYQVDGFVEKPDVDTAKTYLDDGSYYWNSGMFVWKAATLATAVERFMPEMASQLSTLHVDNVGAAKREWIGSFFDEVKGISIDYGIMEKADNVVVFPFDVLWSDVGTWKGLSELAKRFRISLPEEVQNHLKQNL